MKIPVSSQWSLVSDNLDQKGYALLESVLTTHECEQLQSLYTHNLYRSIIHMQRYRFGVGEYKYFSYPLPTLLQEIRTSFYSPLSVVANRWMKSLSIPVTYPEHHEEFIKQCHEKDQLRPTPLILRYESGGYNTLHQDLYGDIYFPFQVVFLLSEPGKDFQVESLLLRNKFPGHNQRPTLSTFVKEMH
jgi:hypothetical protein